MEQKSLISAIRDNANRISNIIDLYLSDIGDDSILSDFKDSEKKDKYLKKYSSFSLLLKNEIDVLEINMSQLSQLIVSKDTLRDIEKAEHLSTFFESCECFMNDVIKFIESNERNFKQNSAFYAPHTFTSARELKIASETFKAKING